MPRLCLPALGPGRGARRPAGLPQVRYLIPAVQPLTDRTDASDPGEPSPPNAIQEPGGEADFGSEGLLPDAFPPTTAKSRAWLAVVNGWCHIMAGQETWASDRMKYIDRSGRVVWPRGRVAANTSQTREKRDDL